MLRWTILLTTLALWLTSLALVYYRFRPRPPQDLAPGSEMALEALFDDAGEPRREWRLFVDLQGLKEMAQSGTAAGPARLQQVWSGLDESRLFEVGTLITQIRRSPQAMRVEQGTDLRWDLPPEVDSVILQILGHAHYQSRASISLDRGLESFRSTWTLSAIDLEVLSWGSLEDRTLNLMQQVWKDQKQIMQQPVRIPVGARAAPNVELMPFQPNRHIRKGSSWEIMMLDTSTLPGTPSQVRTVPMRVTCMAAREIRYADKMVAAFHVASDDGAAQAWYSADGLVLKQAYSILGLNIVAVRREAIAPERK
jgi:hypothetical protein